METQDNEKIEEIEKVENIEITQEPEVEETKDQKAESSTDSNSKTSKNSINLPPFVLAIIVLIIVVNLCYILYNIHLFYKPELLVDADAQIPNTNDVSTEIPEPILDTKVSEITLSKESLELNIDSSETLLATVLPEDATNKDLTWASSDENIAVVDENGTVTAKSPGNCVISASSSDGSITAKCNVKVNPIEVNSLALDDSSVTLGVGQTYVLTGSVSPSNATYRSYTWSSSDNSILTVENGNITAIAEGNATVTITSKNGKTASCSFTVTSTMPSNTIRYAKDTYTVRIGPSNNYYKVATVYRNEEVEILKVSNSWSKIRTSSGVVGYILNSGYSSSKTYHIDNVPYINQFSLGYPTGCEAVSATMAAQYAGYNVSSAQIISATPTDTKGKRQETRTVEVSVERVNEETGETETVVTTESTTDWYGGNPFEVFVGHPTKGLSTGSYGCFAKPITIALQACGVPATNISGCSIDTVLNYVANGKPVVVWCKKNAGDLTEGVTWKYEDGNGSYTELVGEHCAVLIGYDADYVYLNDPSAGKNVKQPRAKFTSNWYKLFSQAVIIN